MELKRCSKCGENKKKYSDFSKSKNGKDGLMYWCKVCCHKHHRLWQKTDAGRVSSARRGKKYYNTEKGKEVSRRASAKHSKKYPDKIKASCKKYKSTEKGRITQVRSSKKYRMTDAGHKAAIRARMKFPEKIKARNAARCISSGPCEYPNCNSGSKIEKHHWDYSKPLEIVSLCSKHHDIADKVKAIIDTK